MPADHVALIAVAVLGDKIKVIGGGRYLVFGHPEKIHGAEILLRSMTY